MQHQSSPHDEQNPELSNPSQPRRPSRRQVMAAGGAGLGLAATGALAGVAGSTVLASRSAGSGHGAGAAGPSDSVVVAHVVDASSGDIDVYVGESQVRIRDKAVATRLSAAAH